MNNQSQHQEKHNLEISIINDVDLKLFQIEDITFIVPGIKFRFLFFCHLL